MFRQLTQAMSGAATLSARVMAKAIAVPADTALWAHETTNRKPPKWNSRNEVVLAAPFALLRDFSVGDDDVYAHVHDREYLDHFSDFYDWYLYPVDLPGQLYLWAAEHLFVRNEMFKGELEVAGQTVSLRSITCPVFLLGGEEDDVTPWQQVHNMRYAVGSSLVRWHLAPGGHIGLFIGRQSQAEYWTPILAQVRELSRPGVSQAQSPALQPEVAAVHQG